MSANGLSVMPTCGGGIFVFSHRFWACVRYRALSPWPLGSAGRSITADQTGYDRDDRPTRLASPPRFGYRGAIVTQRGPPWPSGSASPQCSFAYSSRSPQVALRHRIGPRRRRIVGTAAATARRPPGTADRVRAMRIAVIRAMATATHAMPATAAAVTAVAGMAVVVATGEVETERCLGGFVLDAAVGASAS